VVHRNAPSSENRLVAAGSMCCRSRLDTAPEVAAPSSWDIRVTSWEAHSAAMRSSRLTFDAAPQSTSRLLQDRDALSLLGHLRPLPHQLRALINRK
jgi:hypothetical protein